MQILSSRAIIGLYFHELMVDAGNSWVNLIANLFDSDQASETYAFLGMVPGFREWIGNRQAKSLRDEKFTIRNIKYESTLEIQLEDLRRDKTRQIITRIQDHARRANTHWASLLSTIIVDGESTVAYDGQFFFDTTHSWGDSGTQSNDIDVDISAVPAQVHGSITAPSPEEINQAILKGINQICSFKDDQGEPLNETASGFLAMTPFSLLDAAQSGTSLPRGTHPGEQVTQKSIQVIGNARLSAWDDTLVVFRTDAPIKALIRQEENGIQMAVKGNGSDFEFDHDAHQFGMTSNRAVGVGMWDQACLVTLV